MSGNPDQIPILFPYSDHLLLLDAWTFFYPNKLAFLAAILALFGQERLLWTSPISSKRESAVADAP
ncbi:hypothetical protein M405DRAFT_828579 [Rhizopogon salebrosus TDB-379]|nr:hypothetical protein M405DRAFT_828579 [Rhizopogon salebrosus TDB-379]